MTSRYGWPRSTGPTGASAASGPVGPDRRRGRRPRRAGRVATAAPKRRDGIIEAIPAPRTARRGAVKARTAAINQLKALLVTAPAPVREALDDRSASALVTTCARLRPDQAGLADPLQASKAALQAVAKRIQLLEAELTLADQRLATSSVEPRPALGRRGPDAVCPRTRADVDRQTKEGLSKPEIIRCVKRYPTREVYHALVADFQAPHAT